MFTIEVEHEFCAAHSLTVSGRAEPVHGHNFRVRASLEGASLDRDGLLCDFHTAHAVLVELCEPFANNDLNGVEPFHRVNPSAEALAQHLCEGLAARLDSDGVRVASVRVTEAPGCAAVYRR